MLLRHRTFADGAQTANLLKTVNAARMSSSYAHNYHPVSEEKMFARSQHEETEAPLKPYSPLSKTWDASSSIIFAPSPRRDSRNQTWDPSNGVTFSRGYASIPPLKFKPSAHGQPRGVASGQLDTLALIRSRQMAEERKAQAQAAKLGSTKKPEMPKTGADEQNAPAVAKNISEVAEVVGKSSQVAKLKVAKRSKISNIPPVEKVQVTEEQSNISRPLVNEHHATQATPALGDLSKSPKPLSKTQQSRTKVSTKKQQISIEDTPSSPSPEISAIPSNAALVMEQNRRLEEWRDIYELNDRAEQRATYQDYRALFLPLEDATIDLALIIRSLRNLHRSKQRGYSQLLHKTKSTQEKFQTLERTGKDFPYVASLIKRINASLDEQATILRSLEDLKHHEVVYWNWQNEMFRRNRIEFNLLCHRTRLLTNYIRYRFPRYRETPGIFTSYTALLAFSQKSWNVSNGAVDLQSEVKALVEWEPENPYQNPRKLLSKPDGNGVDRRKVNALGGRSFELILDRLEKYRSLAMTLHRDVIQTNGPIDRVQLGVLTNEGSPGELLQHVLTQPFIEYSRNTNALINYFRDRQKAEFESPQETRNGEYLKFLSWAQEVLRGSHIVYEIESFKESLIKRARELDRVVSASEIRRTCQTLLANMHKAERQTARERVLARTVIRKIARASSRATRASRTRGKPSNPSNHRLIPTTSDSQPAATSGPKSAPSSIKLSSTSTLRAPHPIFIIQQARTSRDNEGSTNADPITCTSSSSPAVINESHRGSHSNSESSRVQSSVEGNDSNPGYSIVQSSAVSGDDSGEGHIIDSNSSSDGEDGSDRSDDGSERNSSEAEEEQQEEEHIPLSYQIPTETLRIAMTASPSSGAAYWRHDLYRGPLDQKISMHYCRNMEVSERVAQYFVEEKVLGFDIEWKPNASAKDGIQGNASLIQLASEDRIALFHIALFKGTTINELLPPTIKKILESPHITKAGVAVRGDCTRLQKYLGVQSRGMLELSHLYRLVKFSATEPKKVNKVLVSLARQVEEHLQLPLAKGAVRESDWSKPLLYDQMLYAASDAYAGFRLYDALEAKRKKLKPTPPHPEHAELNVPIRLATNAKGAAAQKISVVPDEDSSDTDEDFETAPEDNEELDDEIEMSSADGSLEAADSSNAEFVPSTRLIGRVRLLSSHSAEPGSSGEESSAEKDKLLASSDSMDKELITLTKRVGHVRLTAPSSSAAETLPVEEASKPRGTARARNPKNPAPAAPIPKSAEYQTAETWVEEWRTSLPEQREPQASTSQLKAYALWHGQSLGLEDVAAHLRDPPLAISTVSSYVLTAVLLESLPFDAVRIKEPLGKVPHHIVQTRYKSILKRIKE